MKVPPCPLCGLQHVARAEQTGLVPDSGTRAEDDAAQDFSFGPSKAQYGIGQAAGQAASKKGWTPLLELTAANQPESGNL